MKNRIISIAIALVALFSVTLTVTAAQSSIINLVGDEIVEIHCDGRRLVLDRTSRTQVTATCRPNDNTTDPTATPVPPDDPTPTDPPSASVPLCEDHDPTKWHALYDAEKNCHYNHEHKDDPNLVNDIFGSIGAWYGGDQELSYPWQTFKGAGEGFPASPGADSGLMENDLKHEGYGWLTGRDIPCNDVAQDVGCITDYRVQYHGLFTAHGATTRFHSYAFEARGCLRDDPNTCGIIRTGGWLDYGYLVGESDDCPEPCIIELPGMPDPSTIRYPLGPKRGHGLRSDNLNVHAQAVWYGFNTQAAVAPKVALQTRDVWQNIDVHDPYAVNLFCPDSQCNRNGSLMQLHQFAFFAKRKLDPDGDGFIDFNGYTDRYGNIVEGCTETSLDCIPLVIEHLPIDPDDKFFTRYKYTGDDMTEYDISPSGEWWIAYPN